jgi:hypothetical protein
MTAMDLLASPSPVILAFVYIPKERMPMNFKKALGLLVCVVLAVSCFAQMKMPPRGKAELKAGTGIITVDYGRPELKGRDMLSQLQAGQFWRMGMNQASVLNTPIDLTFGSTKIPKGAYSLWLKLAAPDKFELVFNSQTGQWGTQHDATKDVYQVPMKKEALPGAVEVFTIELKGAPKGGVFVLHWGTTALLADFQFAQ